MWTSRPLPDHSNREHGCPGGDEPAVGDRGPVHERVRPDHDMRSD